MKSARISPFRFSFLALLLAATVSVSPLAYAAPATPAPAADPYTTAVNAYIDAATKEMAAIRKELESAEKQGKKEAFAGVRAVFEKCDALVARLKKVGRSDFDPTKAEYERTRATLQKRLVDARRAQMPATSDPAANAK